MTRPNILIIHIDALRSDYARYISSALGADWLVYKEVYTPLYGTDPVVTTVFTGMYPVRHGVLRHGPWVTRTEVMLLRLRTRDNWLPEVLASSGYETMAYDILGRWHRRGFKRYIELPALRRGLIKLSYVVEHAALRASRKVAHAFFRNPPTPYPPATTILSRVLRDLKGAKRPFLAFVHIWDTHTPYLVTLCSPKRQPGTPLSVLLEKVTDEQWKRYLHNLVAWRAYTIEDVVERYRAAACSVGKALHIFIDELRDTGIYDDTLIIIYSDHGESLGEHGAFFDHHTLYEEVIRSFLAIKPAGRGEPIMLNRVSLVDIAPTIFGTLQASGAIDDELYRRLSRKWDGLDLSSQDAHNIGENRVLYFGMVADKPGLDTLFGTIAGPWKYIESFMHTRPEKCPRCGAKHHDQRELFKIDKDPGEKQNLVEKEKEIVQRLRELLLRHLRSARHPELNKVITSVMRLG